MSYNGSGTYVPPTGQPVTTGTVIQSATFNTLVTDIGNTFNNVLPRDGQAAMQGQLKLIDGTSSIPGIAFNGEASSGMFRPSVGALALAASGVEGLRINSAGHVMLGTTTDDGTNKLQVNGAAKITGAATLSSTLNVTGATALATLGVTGNVTAGGTLGVTGGATLASTLNVIGTTSLSNLSLSGSAVVGTTLGVAGNSAIGGALSVTGATNLSSIATSGAATVGTALGVIGNASVGGTLGVSGTTSLTNLTTSGATTIGTTLNVLGMASAASFTGPLTGNVTGNASTATKLQTTRIINGVGFDGTSSIQLPVPISGNDGNAYSWVNNDLNDLSTTGFYRGSNMPHAPDSSWYFITHINHDNDWATQTATAFGTGATYRNATYQRTKFNGGWSPWTLMGGDDYGSDYTVKKRRYAFGAAYGANRLSDITSPEMGFSYSDGGGPTNGPFMHFGGLGGKGDYGCQIQASYQNSRDIYFRTRNDDASTWNPWTTLWNGNNLNPAVAAVADSVVRRTSDGYIQGSYIYMSDDSPNGNGMNGRSTPVTAMMVKQGDDYYRGVSAQYVKDFLKLGSLTIQSKPDGTDLNTMILPGMYPVKGTPNNGPNGGTAFNSLLVIGNGDHDVVTQIYGDFHNSYLFTRTGNNYGTTWAPWKRLAFADGDTLTKPIIRGYVEQFQALNPGAAVTINPDNGTLIELQVTQNMTITLPNAVAGISYTIIVYYQGAYSLTFQGGSSLHWAGGTAPIATSTYNKFDKYVFTCGSTYTLAQDGGRNF